MMIRSLYRNLLFVVLILAQTRAYAQREVNPTDTAPRPIYLFLSVIWEGSKITDFNSDAINSFRDLYPQLPMTHFVSPAYFSHGPDTSKTHATAIRNVIRAHDEIGVSMQSWKSVVQKANVTFRSRPTFWGNEIHIKDCKPDCGKEVPLSAYTPDELRALFKSALTSINEAGFPTPRSLFVSGWMASRPVLDAAAETGIMYDFSAISPKVVQNLLHPFPIYQLLEQTWPHLSHHFSSLTIPTQPQSLIEVGNSGGTLDYNDGEGLVANFVALLTEREKHPKEASLFHIGVHHETAMEFLPRLKYALPKILELARLANIEVKTVVLPKDIEKVSLDMIRSQPL